MGAKCTFEVWTDHQNLQHFRKPQKPNHQQARWQTELQEYDFLLVHKPGAQMKKANLLACYTDFKAGKDDNRDIMLLKDKLFVGNIQVEPIAEDLMCCTWRAKALLCLDCLHSTNYQTQAISPSHYRHIPIHTSPAHQFLFLSDFF